jgi:hypothetical protein
MTLDKRAERLIKRLRFLYDGKPPLGIEENRIIKDLRAKYEEERKTLFIDSLIKEIEIIENASKNNQS